MVDRDVSQSKEKSYAVDTPQKTDGYFLKGASHLGWGMKDRLSRIFNPETGRTVMLAFDHGYIMGPTSGLERIDLSIAPLIEHVDCLMCTRGGLQTCISPTNKNSDLRVYWRRSLFAIGPIMCQVRPSSPPPFVASALQAPPATARPVAPNESDPGRGVRVDQSDQETVWGEGQYPGRGDRNSPELV